MNYLQYQISDVSTEKDFFDVVSTRAIFDDYPDTRSTMHCHDFNVIFWFRKSRGKHIVDFTEYTIDEDSIFFMSRNNMHLYVPANDEDGKAIIFSDDFLQNLSPSMELMANCMLHNTMNGLNLCRVPDDVAVDLDSIVTAMEGELVRDSEDAMRNASLTALLTLFVVTARRRCKWDCFESTPDNRQSFRKYSEFVDLVEREYKKTHSPQDYAQELGISVCLLHRYTNLHGHCTPLKVITDRVMLEAKKMLRFTPLRVKEISAALGFEDPSYFNKFFSRNEGMSPADFRELD